MLMKLPSTWLFCVLYISIVFIVQMCNDVILFYFFNTKNILFCGIAD